MGNPVLVIGVGNPIFTDDAAGVYAVRVARSCCLPGEGVDFAESPVGGLALLQHLSGYQAAVVVHVAITGERAPGEMWVIDMHALPAGLQFNDVGAGLGPALAAARSLRLPVPKRLQCLVIEGQDIVTFGEIPTTPVACAIHPAAAQILSMATELLRMDITTVG